jgi:hypothetical protein
MFEAEAYKMGFSHAAVGAMVRSSYHADQQAHAAGHNSAIYPADDRYVGGAGCAKHLGHRQARFGIVELKRLATPQIGARAERFLTSCGNHDRPQLGVSSARMQLLDDPRHHLRANRVTLVRTVDCQSQNSLVSLDQQMGFGQDEISIEKM